MDKSKLWNELAIPVLISLVASTVIFLMAGINQIKYILLLTAGVYSLVANSTILIRILKKKHFNLAGGSVAHIGIAMMLLGILFSAGYSRVISLNTSGLLFSKDMSDEMNQENVLLFANEPRVMNEYELTYKGQRVELAGVPGFPSKKHIRKTLDEHTVVAIADYIHKGKKVFERGDTLTILPENTYFEVEYKKEGEEAFTLYPRAQVNPNMGLIVSPDIRRLFSKDLYTHISSIPDPETNTEWSEPITNLVTIGERFFVNDFVTVLKKIQKLDDVEGVELGIDDVAAEAIIEVQVKDKTYELKPVFIIKDKMMGNIPAVEEELGIKISFLNILPQEGKFELATETSQRDYIIMKAIEMPYINVLWIGTVVLMLGFTIAIVRRYKEFKRTA